MTVKSAPVTYSTRDLVQIVSFLSASVSAMYWGVESSGWPIMHSLLWLLLISSIAGMVCFFIIPSTATLLVAAGLHGKDCHKRGMPVLPEAGGVAVGIGYSACLTVFVPIVFVQYLEYEDFFFTLEGLCMFLSALVTINAMYFLGFADNVLNLKWRHKLLLPTIAALPVVFVYKVLNGSTSVLLPNMVDIFPKISVDLGFIYYIFLSMLSVFSTNAINILAGINGLEVGQSIVLTMAMIINALIQMHKRPDWEACLYSSETVFSLYILFPFLCCSGSMWIFNKYPARLFVGDTYCYLAGTVLAVAGILGHSSKTLLLFLAPQVANFLYSVPQLFRLLPCPRHRMPTYLEESDAVGTSFTDWTPEASIGSVILWIVETCGIAKVEYKAADNGRKSRLVRISNLTLINFTLWKVGGSMNEGRLTTLLLLIQVAWTAVALIIRYPGASMLYAIVE